MIRSSQNREGFIRNPWSKENDGIHIDTFFKGSVPAEGEMTP